MDSYRLIGTYSGWQNGIDTGDMACWYGPVSGYNATQPGNLGGNVDVSSFNIGATFADVSSDVLNTTSGYGSDELDLTAKYAAMAAAHQTTYSVAAAPVFNWNGNPATPGPGYDTFTINTTTGVYSDGLAASIWGDVKDYEASFQDATAHTVTVTNFQDTNLQMGSGSHGGTINVAGAQRGDFDMSGAGGAVTFNLSPDSVTGTTEESTFVYAGSAHGDTVTVGGTTAAAVPQATENYVGTALVKDGSTSLFDFIGGAAGGNTATFDDNIAADITMTGGSSNMTFLSGGYVGVFTSAVPTASSHGDDVLNLSASGSGAAKIYGHDAGGLLIVNNFKIGRDMLDVTMDSPNGGGIFNMASPTATNAGLAIMSNETSNPAYGYSGNGVILAGVNQSYGSHVTTGSVGGVAHLYIS